MDITAIDYIAREFPEIDLSDSSFSLSTGIWLRKMQEFALIQNQSIDLDRIVNLPHKQKCALNAAVTALYLNDNSDYKNALYNVFHYIADVEYDDINDKLLAAVYHLLNH